MSDVLEAWWDGQHVGQFTRDQVGMIAFTYDDDAPSTPISLSLPREGVHARRAAARFLDNLLPDEDRVRARWAQAHGTSTQPFDLLQSVGQDVAGALVLLPEGAEPSTAAEPALLVSEDELAARILAIRHDPDAWTDPTPGRRFSLGGTQGKFTATLVADQWFWPTATLPSTHIIKPERLDLPGLVANEVATLHLANLVGVDAAPATAWQARGQNAFLIERFDRDLTKATPTRLHAEDLAQALARPSAQKYDVQPREVLNLLRGIDVELAYDWVRQLAFNVHVGNADAHAKNYTLMLQPDGVRLSPLYDSLVTRAWPSYDGRLAMHVAGVEWAQALTLDHWAKFARTNALDPSRVLEDVSAITSGIAEHGPAVFADAGLPPALRTTVEQLLTSTTQHSKRRPIPSPFDIGGIGHPPAPGPPGTGFSLR